MLQRSAAGVSGSGCFDLPKFCIMLTGSLVLTLHCMRLRMLTSRRAQPHTVFCLQARAREEQTQAAQEAAICRREEEAAQRR